MEKEVQIKEAADGPFVTEPNKRGLRTIIVNRCSLIKHSATCCLPPSKRFCCIFLELTNRVSLDWIEIQAVRDTETFLLFSHVEQVVFSWLSNIAVLYLGVVHYCAELSSISSPPIKMIVEKVQGPFLFSLVSSKLENIITVQLGTLSGLPVERLTWIIKPALSFLLFFSRALLSSLITRILSTQPLQLRKLLPKQWSTFVQGAEIPRRRVWTGIMITAVMGEQPMNATLCWVMFMTETGPQLHVDFSSLLLMRLESAGAFAC